MYHYKAKNRLGIEEGNAAADRSAKQRPLSYERAPSTNVLAAPHRANQINCPEPFKSKHIWPTTLSDQSGGAAHSRGTSIPSWQR